MGGKKSAMTAAGKMWAASEQHLVSSDYTVIRNEKGEPTGLTRPMPDEKPGQFAGMPVKVKNVDLANPASFQHGGVVKKSGLARVEKGEKIIPKDKTMASKPDTDERPLLGSTSVDTDTSFKYQRQQADEAAKKGTDKQRAAEQQTMREMAEKAGAGTKAKAVMASPASFKHGGVVKKSGMAHVEKGERVVPKEKAMADEKRDRSKSAMGGKGKAKKSSKGGKKRVKKMNIRHSKNGGYIIEHEHERPSPTEPAPENEEHTAADMNELQDHVAEHMAPQPEPQPEPQPQAGGPGGAPPPAAGGAPGGAPMGM